MRRLIMALALILGLGLGAGALAQDPIVVEEESNALYTIEGADIDILVLEPEFALFYPTDVDALREEGLVFKASDFSMLATIPVVRKSFDLPKGLVVNAGIDLGGVVAEDSTLTGFAGVSVGNLEEPLVWAIEKIPTVGEALGAIVSMLDGRVGYGVTAGLDGTVEHGFVIGLITLEFNY